MFPPLLLFRHDHSSCSLAQLLQGLLRPHVGSFNAMIDALSTIAAGVEPVSFVVEERLVTIAVTDVELDHPTFMTSDRKTKRVYPSECRARASTYAANLTVTYKVTVKNAPSDPILVKRVYNLPIMLKSSHCNLSGLSPSELVKNHEEAEVCWLILG